MSINSCDRKRNSTRLLFASRMCKLRDAPWNPPRRQRNYSSKSWSRAKEWYSLQAYSLHNEAVRVCIRLRLCVWEVLNPVRSVNIPRCRRHNDVSDARAYADAKSSSLVRNNIFFFSLSVSLFSASLLLHALAEHGEVCN